MCGKCRCLLFYICHNLRHEDGCNGGDVHINNSSAFHLTSEKFQSVRMAQTVWNNNSFCCLLSVLMLLFTAVCFTKGPRGVGLLLYGSLVTPLFEELLFRGHIYDLQQRVHRQTFHVMIVNALLFSVWHLGYIVNPLFCGEWMALCKLIVGLLYGLVLASIRSITKSTLCCVLVHGALNSFIG